MKSLERGPLGVNFNPDALWVSMKRDDTDELGLTESDVTRLRLILEGERAFAADSGATFVPNAKLGLAHEGGRRGASIHDRRPHLRG